MGIEIIDILLITIIISIGIIISIEDYYHGRISNRWIKLGFLSGLCIYFFFIIKGIFAPHFLGSIGLDIIIPFKNIINILINTFISTLVGFFLWKKGLLAAGDAKLFILFAFLMPLKFYWKSYLSYFPSVVLLINIFIPIFIFTIYYALNDWLMVFFKYIKDYKNIDKARFKKNFYKVLLLYFKMLAGFSSTFLLIAFFLNNWFPITLVNSSLIFIFSIFARQQINSFFEKKKLLRWLFFIGFSTVVINFFKMGFFNSFAWTFNTLKMVLIFNTLFLILNIILNNYIEKTRFKIMIKDLKPGIMVILNKMLSVKIGKIKGGGISEEQIFFLKEWSSLNNHKEIEAYRKSPFAIWVFIGTIITIIFNKSIIIMIFELFQ